MSAPGVRLLSLRERLGLSQETLARVSGVGVATIRRIEHGANAQYRTLVRLADALGVTVKELIG